MQRTLAANGNKEVFKKLQGLITNPKKQSRLGTVSGGMETRKVA